MTEPAAEDLEVRAARPEDRPAVIELCRASLGWRPDDPNEAFFSWKHDRNAFGASPAWVAVEPDGRLVGLRVFLRWRFLERGRPLEMVRAVDTATHPDVQGRGIFRRLTLGALPELTGSGTAAVFNTPNDQSRPGYLKMGWEPVGPVPVGVRVAGPRSALRLRGARAAAEKWSVPTDAGVAAPELFTDRVAVQRLLDRLPLEHRIVTDRTVDYLRWRYSFGPLAYRALPLGDRLDDGVVVFRVRRRGTATEATVAEVLAPSGRGVAAAIGWILRRTGADYAIGGGAGVSVRHGFLPAPGLGPLLVWRPLGRTGVPAPADLALSLGDVELF